MRLWNTIERKLNRKREKENDVGLKVKTKEQHVTEKKTKKTRK